MNCVNNTTRTLMYSCRVFTVLKLLLELSLRSFGSHLQRTSSLTFQIKLLL